MILNSYRYSTEHITPIAYLLEHIQASSYRLRGALDITSYRYKDFNKTKAYRYSSTLLPESFLITDDFWRGYFKVKADLKRGILILDEKAYRVIEKK